MHPAQPASRPARRGGTASWGTTRESPRGRPARPIAWLVTLALLTALTLLALASCAPAHPTNLGNNLPAAATQTPAPSPSPNATSTPDPSAQIPGWTLVWWDEFNGLSLDTTKWNVASDAPGGYHNCCLTNTANAWAPDDVSITGGALRLTTERRAFQGQPYTSGAVTTQGKFSYLYGRLDIRARVPRGNGMWPAFWLLPANMQGSGYAAYEVDVMEALGQDPRTDYMVHWVGDRHWYCQYTGPDFSAGYHVYSFIWSASSMIWLIDGDQRCTFTSGMPNTPMYLILNTRIGGTWPVPPDASTSLPQYTDIDYVRLYSAGNS